jgi:pimeloyl-ACP methyl ester carboxylesterase
MRSRMASEPRRDVPDVQYARSGDVNIAYNVVGAGRLDLVFAPGYVSHLTHALENPTVAGFFERLASLGRLIRFDRRGIGLSDRPRDVATLETRMDDIRAVMDATGSRRAALIATGDAGAMATLFAATYPERVAAVVLWSPYARGTAAADYPIGETAAEWQRQLDEIEQGWGTRPFLEKQFAETGAELSDDEALFEWFCEALRALNLEVRAGLHTGECERVDGKLGGIAIPTGARIAALAEPGEVLVSSTVRDLVAGSAVRFEDRGQHELKGVPGEWRLYAVGNG